MDAKKDIYNLWIQYTTKNEEIYFRQFIEGFVNIWEQQIDLKDLNFENAPDWREIKVNTGPNLHRLPDELIPAIEKFLIIARDKGDEETIADENLNELILLLKCLIIICRNFDNIKSMASNSSNFIGNILAINNRIINICFEHPNSSDQKLKVEFVKVSSNFLEAIFDPFLSWRSYQKGSLIDLKKIDYKVVMLNVEIVPFIYDYFEQKKYHHQPEISVYLLNLLGSVISGSQENALKAVSPATISILIQLIAEWELNTELRKLVLGCFSISALVLQKSRPEQRQIDLLTIFQMYAQSVESLLKTTHFLNKATESENFQIAEEDDKDQFIDINALSMTIQNMRSFLADSNNKTIMGNILYESKFVALMVSIPEKIRSWHIDRQHVGNIVVNTITYLCSESERVQLSFMHAANINKLFDNLQLLGKPTHNLIEECLSFAFCVDERAINAAVVVKMIEWIGEMGEDEQDYLSGVLLKKSKLLESRRLMSDHQCIDKTCLLLLKNTHGISDKCYNNLIRFVEELAKYSITSIELKHLFNLISTQDNEHKKLLLDTLIKVSSSCVLSGVNSPAEYFDIQSSANGIQVSDVEKWELAGNGFVFHTWLRLDKFVPDAEATDCQNFRRYVFTLINSQDCGYEIFVTKNGNLVLGVTTKKDFYTTTVANECLNDGRWHSISIVVNPPKRLFSYHQINIFVDGNQKVGSNIKYGAFVEPFQQCSIGIPHTPIRQSTWYQEKEKKKVPEEKPKSLFERSFFSHVPSFTLPLKSSGSLDPSVKNYPIGMQDIVFGQSFCLKGQMGYALLADPTVNLKAIHEAGPLIAPILANDLIEGFDLGTKFVFCFSPSACQTSEGVCVDISPNEQHVGHLDANICKTIHMQDAINNIGGVICLLPVLEDLKHIDPSTKIEIMSRVSPSQKHVKTNDGEWELVNEAYASEMKIYLNPLASFLCLLRNFITNNELNQECLLKSDCIGIISKMIYDCHPDLLDVNVLMALQTLVETVQAEVHKSNMQLLDTFYNELVFDFRIWARAEFQIVIGHVQHLYATIKVDRKYFRKHFGVQYMLDVVQQFFVTNEVLTANDAKTVRDAFLRIIRYYILKEINHKEVSALITFLLTIKNDLIIVEVLEMLNNVIESKNCKDQILLLTYEPGVGELLYALVAEKSLDQSTQAVLVKFLESILNTDKISNRHKNYMRLIDPSIECNSLYHGLYSFLFPIDLSSNIILRLLDMNLSLDTAIGYSAALCIIYHLNLSSLQLKLEISRRLLTCTFTKTKSPQLIAKQIGWQESLARLLIKKPIELISIGEKDKTLLLSDVEELFSTEFEIGTEAGQDLMEFDEERMEMVAGAKNSLFVEAANALENEMKEIAGTAVDNISSVVGNISSVYSVLKQTTSDIQGTIESFASGSFEDSKKSLSVSSSEDNVSLDDTVSYSISTTQDMENASLRSKDSEALRVSPHAQPSFEDSLSEEETLVYLITNILFTIMWRGVENRENSWKDCGQVLACINLIGLSNELYSSHLTLRLKMLEMGIQSALIDLAESDQHTLAHQQNAAYILRMVYDLVVLDPNEDETKKCSLKLLDGVLTLLDALMVFQQYSLEEGWTEMVQICWGLLLKCMCNPQPEIVTTASSKFHSLLQKRQLIDQKEVSYLLFTLNKELQNAIESGNTEKYSYIGPVLKTLLEKTRNIMNLNTNTPDLPSTSAGPMFLHDFQMYCTSKQWIDFIEKKIKPLHSEYQKKLSDDLWEPLNRFWAECYEACKTTSQKRAVLQLESRKRFQERILNPYRIRQSEESARWNVKASTQKSKQRDVEGKWQQLQRYLYGKRGPWNKK